MGAIDRSLHLLNAYQRGFPLQPDPFRVIGWQSNSSEGAVLDYYRQALADGMISRIGAVVAPRRVGWSTLAALAVPPDDLERVGALVSAWPQVNHNYEREDEWNLWFVLGDRDEAAARDALAGIAAAAGAPLLTMPLRVGYHIDLGFDLHGGHEQNGKEIRVDGETRSSGRLLDARERQLLAALDDGLPLVPRPFAPIAERAGLSESETIERLNGWLDEGILKRFGVVVRHRPLGYTANAMCVWDVPDDRVDTIGRQLAGLAGVTLCYRRERDLPHWPYNLYCMIHGLQRDSVLALRRQHAELLGLDDCPHKVLFSRRCFKQCGARHGRTPGAAA